MIENNMKKLSFLLVLCFFINLSFSQKQAVKNKQINKEFGYELQLIGSPVKSLPYLNLSLAEPDKGIESDILINSFNPRAVYFARYNHIKDKASLHPLKNSQVLWGITHYGKNKVYVGGCTKSQLYEYDIKSDKIKAIFSGPLENNSLGWVLGENYIWSLAEGLDGKIYGSTYPNGKLFSFDPKTRFLVDYGQMAEGEMYARNVCAGFPGKIYIGIGTHARLIEFDLETKLKRQILPKKYQNQSFVYNVVKFGDYLAACVTPGPYILIFDPNTRELIKEIDLKKYDKALYHFNPIVHDSKLYFGMIIKGDLFSIDKNFNVNLEVKNVGAPFGLAKDRYLFCMNSLKKFSIVDLQDNNKIVKSFVKNIEGELGNSIFAFNNGPNGKIYGGGFINQHLFEFDQNNSKFIDFGPSANTPGQINALIEFNNKLYIGHYIYARLSEYDPKLPWNPGDDDNSNPKIIASIENDQDKILDMDKDSRYIYCATSPTYGKSGGCLTILDPVNHSIENFRNVIKDQALRVLRVLKDGNLAIGSDIGYIEMKDSSAVFMIWDPKEKKEIYSIRPIEKSSRIIGIAQLENENICFGVDSTFCLLDYKDKEIIFKHNPGFGMIYRLLYSSDGFVYGIAKNAIFMFDPKTNKMNKLFSTDAEMFINFIIEDRDKRIFLAINDNVYELKKLKK